MQRAAVEFRTAHHQAGRGRIDKARAIDRDTVGVGQYIISLVPEDLLGAVERRCITANDLVENHPGRLAAQLRVGCQLPGQLRLPGLQGVVEHYPLAVDVVIKELVMGQASGVGRNNIDDRHPALIVQLRRTTRSIDPGNAIGQRQRR